MRILVTGKTGQLGHDVLLELERRGHEAVGTGSADMDITDESAVSLGKLHKPPSSTFSLKMMYLVTPLAT